MSYDLAIIGAGWAGVNAAHRAAQLGLKTILFEKGELGGTCLNRGCIPTKALLQSAKVFTLAKKAKNFGVSVKDPLIDFSRIQARKEALVKQLSQGVEYMLKDTEVIRQEAKLVSGQIVSAGGRQISAQAILLASGSRPMGLPTIKIDGKKIVSSDQMLNLDKLPQSLLIIGGGVIGCEFATLFSALGTTVTIVEKLPQLLPGTDKEVAKKIEVSFKKKGIKVNTNSEAGNFDFNEYELVLLCIGRAACVDGFGIEEAGVAIQRGKVQVDQYLRTSVKGIFSAGDCSAGIMLAHYAAYQGRLAAENIARPQALKAVSTFCVPSCIFTDPEIACAGMDEDKLLGQGRDFQVHKFDFLASGMARILDETEGMIKIVSDKKTGVILGASLIGPRVTELVGTLGLCLSCGLSVSQLKDTIFAHPTLSEGIHESLL